MANEENQLKEEDIFKISALDQQSKRLENDLAVIDTNIEELAKIKESITELSNKKENEILTSLGSGVFLKASSFSDKSLFVEVGGGIIVKKSSEETLDIINEQMLKLNEARMQVLSQLELYSQALQKVIQDINIANQ